jgi:integrase
MLRKSYGSAAVTDFGPLAMKAVRQSMITAGWTRKNINRQVARIRQVFRWGVSNEVVPSATLTALEAVEPLQRGRSEAKEAPPVEMVNQRDVEAVKPFVNRYVWAMIQLQLITAMRPGEVCIMRMRDITVAKDADGREYWTYNMPSHKTSHHGKARTVTMYEGEIKIILPFVTTSTEAYFFSPADAEAERNSERFKNGEKAGILPLQLHACALHARPTANGMIAYATGRNRTCAVQARENQVESG